MVVSIGMVMLAVVGQSLGSPHPARIDEVRQLLRQAQEIAWMLPTDTVNRHTKDATLREIASTQVTAGDLEGALRTVSGLDPRWGFPHYHSVRLQLQDALQTMAKEPRTGLQPLQVVVEKAESILGEKVIPAPMRVALSCSVAAAQWLAGDEVGAGTTLNRAVGDKRRARERIDGQSTRDEELRQDLRAEVAAVLAESGNARAGLQILKSDSEMWASILDSKSGERVLAHLIKTQAKAGDARGAMETAAMVGEHRQAEILLDVAQVQYHSGQESAARMTLAVVERAAESIDDWPWDWELQQAGFLMRLAHLQVRVGSEDAAGKAVKNAQRLISRAAPLSTPPYLIMLGTLQAKLGLPEDSSASLHSALALVRDNPDGGEQFTLAQIAAAFASTGDFTEAMRIAEGLDAAYKGEFLRRAAVARAEVGDADRALGMLEGIKANPKKAEAIREVAQAMATRDHLPRILSWSDLQEDPLFKAYALLGLAEGLLQAEAPGRVQP